MENSNNEPTSPRTVGTWTKVSKGITKPILKKSTQPPKEKPKGLIWDEHNLTENEVEKSQTTKMKIDEPKTPFNRAFKESDEEDLNSSRSYEGEGLQWQSLESAVQNLAEKEQVFDSASGSEKDDTSESEKDDKGESGSDGEKKAFAKKRKTHYNEYKLLQQWKQRRKDEDVEDTKEQQNQSKYPDEEGEEDDEGGNEHSNSNSLYEMEDI